MKKIIAFIVAIIISVVIVNIYNYSIDNKLNQLISENKNSLYYWLDDEKFDSADIAKTCLNSEKSKNILVLGSSELSSFNAEIVNNGNSNFNMYLVGRGHTQSFQSALTLGAIEEATNIKKAVLIISPQWFEEGELTSEIFASRFQKNNFSEFMKNNKISYETKQQVIDILKKLEISDEVQLNRIKQYESAYLKYNVVDKFALSILDSVNSTKQKRKLIELLENTEKTKIEGEMSKFEDNDIEKLLEVANEQGESACTNNDFGVYNEYYDTYIKENLLNYKDSKKNEDFSRIEEYEYLELFLKICNELEIQPLIINIPVNGRWYDYTGVSKESRENYYNTILDIAKKYNSKVADFSEYEYEKYFLKDIMHLGWKGWIKVDEAIYNYYCE